MTARRPAEVFPPGDFLREEMEARGWTQTDLADMLGWSTTLVHQLLMGERSITPETAQGLAAALGTSPEFWMNLDAAYQLGRVPTG
jgi:HTH-type transcriptional regulator/antitoxin HigA